MRVAQLSCGSSDGIARPTKYAAHLQPWTARERLGRPSPLAASGPVRTPRQRRRCSNSMASAARRSWQRHWPDDRPEGGPSLLPNRFRSEVATPYEGDQPVSCCMAPVAREHVPVFVASCNARRGRCCRGRCCLHWAAPQDVQPVSCSVRAAPDDEHVFGGGHRRTCKCQFCFSGEGHRNRRWVRWARARRCPHRCPLAAEPSQYRAPGDTTQVTRAEEKQLQIWGPELCRSIRCRVESMSIRWFSNVLLDSNVSRRATMQGPQNSAADEICGSGTRRC